MNDKVYSVQDVARMLNADRSTVCVWIRDGKLRESAIGNHKKYIIDEYDLNEFIKNYKVNNAYSIEDVAKMLNVSHMTIYRWVIKGKLKASMTYEKRRRYMINKNDLNEFMTIREKEINSYYVSDIAKKFNVRNNTVLSWIKNEKLKASTTDEKTKRYIINEDDLNEFIDRYVGTGYDAITISKIFGVSKEAVRIWIRNGKLKASRVGKRKKYIVSKEDLNEFINKKIK